MKFTILFLSSLLFFYSSQKNLARRPVRIFHGLGDDCSNHFHPHENFKCVETGAGKKSFYNSIKTQAMIGCEILKSEVDILQPSFYVFAYSQGGLIARWIQLNCEGVGHLIKRMVLVGTPNLGIDKLPNSDAFKEKVYSKTEINEIVYSSKDYLKTIHENERKKVISELFRKAMPAKKPMKSSLFDTGVKVASLITPALKSFGLGPLNYVNPKLQYSPLIDDLSKETQIGNLNNLDFMVVIANRDERVVLPFESVTFGIKIFDEKGNLIPKPQTSNFIKTYPMIKELWQKKKLTMCLSDSSHAKIEFEEHFWIKSILFSEYSEAEDYQSSSIKMKNDFLKWYPNYCTFNNPDEELPEEEFNEMTNGQKGISRMEFALNKIII